MDALTNRHQFSLGKINRLVYEFPYLPEEIIEEIMIRLPLKSLGRFNCVSKSWNSLITSKRFIKAHFEKSATNTSFANHKVITILHNIQESSLLSLLCEPSVRPVEYKFPTHDDCPSDIVGCCDGLVCLFVDDIDFIIWNPSTKKFTLLPSVAESGLELVTSGFGYDESTDDYKVFAFLRGDKKGLAKVYSLKTDSWTIVDITIKIDLFISYFGAFFNGKLHWKRYYVTNEHEVQWEISTFDLENENFGFVELPHFVDCGSYKPSFVGVLAGGLCMICEHGTTQLDIWIMKNYNIKESWYKMAALSLPVPYEVNFMKPLFVRANGEILFAVGLSYVFSIYHPKDARFSHPQLIDQEEFLGAHIYTESLVSAVPLVQTPRTADELEKLQIIAERYP